MKLAEIAGETTPTTLQRLGEHRVWAWAAGRELGWLEAQQSPEAMAAARQALPRVAQDVLSLIVSRFRAELFTAEHLLREASGGSWSGTELRLGLGTLHSCGIVWARQAGWGERAYLLPETTFPLWVRELWPLVPDPIPAQLAVTRAPSRRLSGLLSSELVHAVAALTDSGLSFTRSGLLPKRTLQRMERQLQLPQGAVEGLPLLRASQPASYPPTISWVLDLCIACGWLTAGDSGYVFDRTAWLDWLDQNPQQCESGLVRMLLEECALSSERLAHPAAALAGQASGVWYAAEALSDWVSRAGRVTLQAAEASCRELLGRMSALGWVELGSLDNGKPVYRILVRAAPEYGDTAASESLRVLPNGDLIVTREAPLRVRWVLELTAERVSHDVVTMYRISPASIERGRRQGWTAESLIEALEAAAAQPLEPAYASLLRDWDTAVSSTDMGAADVSVAAGVRDGAASSSMRSEPAAAAGKSGSRSLLQPCGNPTIESLLPDLPRLPTAWKNQMRRYHPSTAREIVEAALQRGLPVQLGREHRLDVLIPDLVQDGEDGWTVYGRLRQEQEDQVERVRLGPEMWEEMQLLLPPQV